MKLILISISLMLTLNSYAKCIQTENHLKRVDLLTTLLEEECAQDVRELKKLLEEDGLIGLPAIVANRGFHNPDKGSFSIFESVKGFSQSLNQEILPEHLYFGHFTHLDQNNKLALDQESANGKLIIEAIAYDFKQGIYNFYELVGTLQEPQWFYRGNSFDAFEDNKLLKLGKGFGTRMRCSACHNSGGPIMKELAPPHNDWWTKARGLPLGDNHPSEEMQQYLSDFIDASHFAKNVKSGIELLQKKKILTQRSLREQLRPLFCTTEINLKSDLLPLEDPTQKLSLSTDIFVDPLLVSPFVLSLDKVFYTQTLANLGSRFPETRNLDADHGFLVPVRSEVNHLQVKELIDQGVIDEEFALDVLSIDFKNPLFSEKRCGLLKLVPESLAGFKKNLSLHYSPEAKQLVKNLMVSNKDQHQALALAYLKTKIFDDLQSVEQEVQNLNKLRLSVFKDEISQNPRGQILEPGFRVIFPEVRAPFWHNQ